MNDRYALGRSLQLLGMIILPLGIAAEVFKQVTLGQSLFIAAFGMIVFLIGYQIQPKL